MRLNTCALHLIQGLSKAWGQRARYRLKLRKNARSLQHFAASVRQRLKQERASQAAASLTYTTILALVPLVTVALALFSAFPAFDQLRQALENYFIEALIPKPIASTVTSYLTMFASKARGLSLMGAAFLLVTVVAMFLTIENTLNAIWQVPARRLKRVFISRLMAYWAVLTVAPFVLGVSFYATAQLITSTQGFGNAATQAGRGLMWGLPISLACVFWAMVYKTMPNAPVRLHHAFFGAGVSSLLLAILKELFVVYLAKYANFKALYGAFSVIPVFLIWLYLGWWATLLGASITALLPTWGQRYRGRTRAMDALLEPLRVLRAFKLAQEPPGSVGVMDSVRLQNAVYMDMDQLLAQLNYLQSIHWLGKIEQSSQHPQGAWVLLEPLSTLKMAPLLDAAFLDKDSNVHLDGKHPFAQQWRVLGNLSVEHGLALLESNQPDAG